MEIVQLLLSLFSSFFRSSFSTVRQEKTSKNQKGKRERERERERETNSVNRLALYSALLLCPITLLCMNKGSQCDNDHFVSNTQKMMIMLMINYCTVLCHTPTHYHQIFLHFSFYFFILSHDFFPVLIYSPPPPTSPQWLIVKFSCTLCTTVWNIWDGVVVDGSDDGGGG